MILREYRKDIMELRFDSALNFISDFAKHELFTNQKYAEMKNGSIPLDENNREFVFVENYENLMKELPITKGLLDSFDDEFEASEKKVPGF